MTPGYDQVSVQHVILGKHLYRGWFRCCTMYGGDFMKGQMNVKLYQQSHLIIQFLYSCSLSSAFLDKTQEKNIFYTSFIWKNCWESLIWTTLKTPDLEKYPSTYKRRPFFSYQRMRKISNHISKEGCYFKHITTLTFLYWRQSVLVIKRIKTTLHNHFLIVVTWCEYGCDVKYNSDQINKSWLTLEY